MAKTPVPLTMPELKGILGRYLEAGPGLNYAVKILGHPGIGKSDAVRQTAEEKNFLFIDTRLAFKENIDLGGYPVPDHDSRRMVYYRPRFIPPREVPEGYDGVLWFLDEANRAHPTVIQTLFQIITEGVCGDHALPENTAVVLAGNLGEEDNTAITDFDDSALDGRLAVFHLMPDAANWLTWAHAEDIHPSIIRYISRFPERLWDETRIHPNPRGWHQVSQALKLSYGLETPESLARQLKNPAGAAVEKVVSSLIGVAAASEFTTNLTAPRTLTTSQVLAGNPEKLQEIADGQINTEDILWALSGAMGVLRKAAEASPNGLKPADLDALASTLLFVNQVRADMQVGFFYQLVRQCSLFTQIPKALALMDDRNVARELSQAFGRVLDDS